MPYIKQEKRVIINPIIDKLSQYLVEEGDYNYAITKLMHNYIQKNGLKYKHCNAIVGVVECAKQEFLRTIVGPYENKKRQESGSITDLDKEC